ncbi:TDP-N-acetylfucosamine:lipid II N-acetylfucosaminyltransferase [Psychroflexus halocasei]|uniref:4-alpha-L-fucosyltransferase glycosyl transferase group 56 n=1 Tax=Psychroflexus halocasei TaxID=908615 RepID=A0A1H4D8R5_9FLAO|nr:TDP-N-acetylfucosamine:lipid II N-acetylfucosaminyltransferase [Psychroflexus halocasei]SEA69183.1 4-alpha-L-fucosyltransferase glycosyl transferase group 56 [Psychroflexus halocasei]
MKIIHIASDQKFINSAYFQFESLYPGENLFYLFVDDIEQTLKYVQQEERMVLVEKSVEQSKGLPNKFGEASMVFFHGLEYYSSIVLNRTPNKYKKIWILWGMEIYSNPYLFKAQSILDAQTLELFESNKAKRNIGKKFKDIFRGFFYRIKYRTYGPYKEVLAAINKANYCAILYKEEFNLVKNKLPDNELTYLKYSYYPIEKMLDDPKNKVTDNNILLGNSASYTNNHLEVFSILSKFNLDSQKVITPLSYGDQNYKEEIITRGHKEFKNNFEPLVNFMPLHEYNAYIQKCGIVIMNHHRQQAVGNVLTMLWMGAKVYLDQRNTLYYYLKRIGIHIYTVSEDLVPSNLEALKQLDEEKQLHNRNILRQEIGEKILLKKLKSQIEKIA